MQSVQESKQELEASIRYAENAISSAKATIESMAFRQEMAQKQYSERTGREEALTKLVKELEETNEKLANDNYNFEREVAELRDIIDRMSDDAKGDSVTIKLLNEEKADLRMQIEGHRTNMALLTDEAEFYKKSYTELEVSQGKGVPTMPVIPKDVAIAIFREGIAQGVCDVCDELDNTNDIEINESGYTGGFEVSFSKYIDLSEHLDLHWIRDKVGNYEELNVINALMGLCADKKFECRIHGVDDPQTKSND